MIFNLKNYTLYTDDKVKIKKLSCPKKIEWDKLSDNGENTRPCHICNNVVLDTSSFNDLELLKILKNKPDTCLVVDFNQKNLSLEL